MARAAALTFFGGKGGVGKTTCAAAYALRRAESGRRILVVSTDPAHSLGDALGQTLRAQPRPVRTARGSLRAAELDAAAALARWLNDRRATLRLIADRGTYFDREDVESFLDLSLPGVDELIALLELRRLGGSGRYDEVVVDTAPTGHTLRLLAMPRTFRNLASVLDQMQEKHRVVAESLGGAAAGDVADALIEELQREGEALEAALRDEQATRFTWVSLPEALSVGETRDGLRALEAAGIPVAELVVNRLTPPPDGPCALCSGRRRLEAEAVQALRPLAGRRPLRFLPALEEEPRGVAALRPLGQRLLSAGTGASLVARTRGAGARSSPPLPRAEGVPAEWGKLRLLMFGGKGGVGKSTCAAAAALALALARPRRRVLLLSTDPARRTSDVLRMDVTDRPVRVKGGPPNLQVQEIDADAAFVRERERYRQAVTDLFEGLRGDSRLDPVYDRAILEDLIDLAPPGLDEVFATVAVMDAFQAWPLVVNDTAPTGHALRLLEMPQLAREWVHALMRMVLKYQRLVGLGRLAEELLDVSRRLSALQSLLTDPSRTRFITVTRAAQLPRQETQRLLAALGRLEVPTGGLIVNALTPEGCKRCRRQARVERRETAAVFQACDALRGSPCPAILAPACAPPPRGAAALRRFGQSWGRR